MRSFEPVSPNADVRCPVCHAACHTPVRTIYTVERAALHYCPPWRDRDRHQQFLDCIGKMWPEGVVRIRVCDSCGFSFGDPFLGGNEEFYRILHGQMGYPPWRWDYDVALAHPLVKTLNNGRALDIGAGSGNFLEKLGSGWEKHSVESSEVTRGVLAKKGIPAHASLDDPELLKLRGTFDLITMFQVLEHVAEFYPLLDNVRKLLKPGGILFITVPDGDAMVEQERITGCPDVPPNHINRWSPESLALALEKTGLRATAPTYEPPAWSKVSQHLYLTVIADAASPTSLAAQIYRIRQKSIRAPLLRIAGAIAAFRLVKYGSRLRNGGAFALAATATPEGKPGAISTQ